MIWEMKNKHKQCKINCPISVQPRQVADHSQFELIIITRIYHLYKNKKVNCFIMYYFVSAEKWLNPKILHKDWCLLELGNHLREHITVLHCWLAMQHCYDDSFETVGTPEVFFISHLQELVCHQWYKDSLLSSIYLLHSPPLLVIMFNFNKRIYLDLIDFMPFRE